MPANLDIILMRANVDKVSVFTSATKPLLLPFYWRKKANNKVNDQDEPGTFTMMFKTGDDMRQDALCLQMFSVMQHCLPDSMDMKFTIYNLIPMTRDDGLL